MTSVKAVQRVMVACVTTEVVKITSPAEKLDIDRIHLLNHIRKATPGDNDQKVRQDFYESIYNENLKFFRERDIEVIEHTDAQVFKFDECFKTVYGILAEETKNRSVVYVNISSGTPEYSAAAAIASMMVDGVELFTIGTKASGFTVPFDKQKEMSMHEGKLVGSAFDVHDPILIDKFPLSTPDLGLLRALKIFNSVPEMKRSNVNVIRELIKRGEWKYPSSEDGITKGTSLEYEDDNGKLISFANRRDYETRQRKEAVQYQRGYIDRWKIEGWIEKSNINGKRYKLSEKGKRYTEIFVTTTEL